jgi:ABC-type proline/glycine betaine transport system permease subunit
MSWLTQNLTPLFQFIPGFISAAIFFTLTAHPKASEFERVVQALVFSVLLKCSLMPTKWAFMALGKRMCFSLGAWNADVELLWMILYSVPLGLVAA